jgi:hypothetical protein
MLTVLVTLLIQTAALALPSYSVTASARTVSRTRATGQSEGVRLGEPFPVESLGRPGVPHLNQSELRRIAAVNSAVRRADRSRLMFAFVRFEGKIQLVMFLRPLRPYEVPRILGLCNVYFAHGATFAGPGGATECLNWKPSAADRAAQRDHAFPSRPGTP